MGENTRDSLSEGKRVGFNPRHVVYRVQSVEDYGCNQTSSVD